MQRYGVSIDQLKRLKKHKPFVMAVRKHQKEIAENGIDFKMKAKLMANDLIDTAYLMAKDPKTPATVRSGQIKDIVRWAELEPQKGAGDSEGGTMFNIQINL